MTVAKATKYVIPKRNSEFDIVGKHIITIGRFFKF